MLFMGYGALLARSIVRNDSKQLKRLGSITSGIGLVLIFVAGFGLMAKLYNNGTILDVNKNCDLASSCSSIESLRSLKFYGG